MDVMVSVCVPNRGLSTEIGCFEYGLILNFERSVLYVQDLVTLYVLGLIAWLGELVIKRSFVKESKINT